MMTPVTSDRRRVRSLYVTGSDPSRPGWNGVSFMGEWNNGLNDLRRRQQAEDMGFLGKPGRKFVQRKTIFVMLAVSLVGLVMIYASPLVGLGIVLFVAGGAGIVMNYVAGWLAR